jgi:uncharacterized protein (DUF433 family)
MSHQGLIDRYIDSSPYGIADARLRDYGVHVWAIIGQLRVATGGVDEVAQDYRVPPEAIKAALAYYEQNKEYIDARLLLNSA